MSNIIAKGLVKEYEGTQEELDAHKADPDSYYTDRINRLVELKAPSLIIAATGRSVTRYKPMNTEQLFKLFNDKYAPANAIFNFSEHDDTYSTLCQVNASNFGITFDTVLFDYKLTKEDLNKVLFFWNEQTETLVFPEDEFSICLKRDIVSYEASNIHCIADVQKRSAFMDLIQKPLQWELRVKDEVYTGTIVDVSDHQDVEHFAELHTDNKIIPINGLSTFYYSYTQYNQYMKSTSVCAWSHIDPVNDRSEPALLTPIN